VTKRSHPDDARMVQVRLTRRGAATLRRDRAARASWLADAIKAQLNTRQRARLDEVAEVLGALASYEPET
jgi:DNA-binding MarR family transcriptional regulator